MFETNSVSTYRLSGNADTGYDCVLKTGEEFAEEVNEVYEHAASLGGRVVSHEMTKLKVIFRYADGPGPTATGRSNPEDHAIIVCEIPDQPA